MTRKNYVPKFVPSFVRHIWQIQRYDVSPDGSTLVYSMNKGKNYELHQLDLRTRKDKLLVSGRQSCLNPEYSPDGKWIVYQSDKEGNEYFDIFVIPAAGGKPKNLTKSDYDDSSPRWSPDGEHIAFISNRVDDLENVWILPFDGGETRQLTHCEEPVAEIAWNPTGSVIAYMTGVGDGNKIGLADPQGKGEKIILEDPNAEFFLGPEDAGRPHPWSPDGKRLAFVSSLNDYWDIGTIELGQEKIQWVVRNEWEKTLPHWSHDGERIAFGENNDGDVVLKTVSLQDGRIEELSPREGVVSDYLWMPGDRGLITKYSGPKKTEDLYLIRGNRRSRITRTARKPLPTRELAAPRVVSYESFDGREIRALLYRPRHFDRRIAIVNPHGGPEWQKFNYWDEETQLLVAQGYTVFSPNYRGSTGYGRSFRKLSDRDLGGGDMKDVLHAAKYLREAGLIPADRIAISGHSYGGYLSLNAATQAPDLWAAAICIVGFFDWVTEVETERGYLKAYDHRKMGDPRKEPDFFYPRSPVHFLDRLKAPVMIVQGAQDPRCPVTEGRQVRDKLRTLGRTFEYHEFKDEGHSLRKRENQIKLYSWMLDFLDKHIPIA